MTVRRPGRNGAAWRWSLVLAAALVVTWMAVHQARDLRVATRLEEFLPAGSPAADAYRDLLATFGGFERVHGMVLWRGPEPDTVLLAAAADLVAERLRALPEVTAARAGLEPADEEFLYRWLLPRAPLFLGTDEELLRRLEPAAIRGRLAELRRGLTGPMGKAQARWRAADPLGLALDGGPGGRLGAADLPGALDPLTGAIVSPGGDAVLLSISPAVGELDTAAGRRLAAGLEAAQAELAAWLPAAPLEIVALGGPLYAAQDEVLVRADLRRTIGGSALAVGLLLVLHFGGVGIPAALLAAVAAGVAWTAGLVAAVSGEVSVLGISFAAMLLGLGVDYGIHGASRFRAARLAGRPPEAAVRTAMRQTGPAILASVVTTATAFLVLSLAHFRPVKELGQVMAGGIVAILAATVAVGAPALALGARRPSDAARRGRWTAPWRWLGRSTAAMIGLGERRPRLVIGGAVAVTLAAAAGVSRLEVSLDLRSLRPENHPAFAAEELLGERFSVGLEGFTVMVRGENLGVALQRAGRVTEELGPRLPAAATVTSPAGWLPDDRRIAARLALVGGEPSRRAAAELRRGLAAEGLREEPFRPALEVLEAAGRGEAPAPIPEAAWPTWLDELVRPWPGGGVVAAVRVTTPLGVWPEGPPEELIEALQREVSGAAVASAPRVGAELREVVLADFSRLDLWTLAAVAAVVLTVFGGRPRPSIMALLPVTLGGLWTLGLAGAVGVPLDPFSIVVAPLVLGIGIDDGLHALVGARVHGGLLASLRENGRAMALTTLTTSAAFASLLASRVPSLRSGGVLVASGALFCLLVTLVLLPALARLGGGERGRG